MKQKVTTLRALYISHVEAMQNVVRLHRSGSEASFQELSSLISSNGHSIEEVRYAIIIEIAYVYLVCLTSILHSCSTIIKSYFYHVNQFLASEATKAGSILDDLQASLSNQQGELTLFASELRHVSASGFASFYIYNC